MEDIREQFDMQQNLIKQLKDVVKSHQSQLQEKEYQVQKLSTEQSSRLASLSQQVAALEDSAPANQSTSSVGGAEGRRERMQEIKRQLEEQRRQQQEQAAEKRQELEAMVRALQARVEDQEYRYDSCDSADSGSDGEPEYGSSPRKSAMLSDSVRSKEPAELYGVILAKDNEIYELTDKVSALEATIVDLKETLHEKESVISARTEAVSLVTKALTERGRGALESLDETRQQMRQMQEAFAVHEADWNVQREKLTRQLQKANEGLETSEENMRKIESAKFDLVLANANLQEKLVNMQTSAKQESVRAAALESELAGVRRELSDQQKMVFRVKSQKRQRLSQLEAEAGQLTTRISELQQLNDELRQQDGGAEQLETDRNRLQAECDSLRSQLADLQRGRQLEQQQLQLEAEQARDQLADTQQQLLERQQLLDSLRQQVDELETSADEKDALVSKLSSEQANLELQVADLTASLEQTRSDLEEASVNLENTTFTLEKTQIGLQETSKGLEETEKIHADTKTSLAQSEQRLKQSRSELELEQSQRTLLATELEEAKSEIERLRLETADSQLIISPSAAEEEADVPRSQVTADASSQSDEQTRSDGWCQHERQPTTDTGSQPDLTATSEAACQMEERATEVVAPADDDARRSVSGLEAQIDVLATDLETSRRLLEEARADRDRVALDCDKLKESVSTLETQVKSSETFVSELQYRCKQLQEEVENEKCEKEEVRGQLEARIAVLEAPDAAGDPKQDLKKLVKKLKARLKQELKSKASLEEKVSIMKQKTEELRANISELEAGWRTVPTQADMEGLQTELEDLRSQIEKESVAKRQAEEALSESTAAFAELEAKVAETARSSASQEMSHVIHAAEGVAETSTSSGGSDNKQKMKLMKAKLRKEIQNKVELQKELAEVKDTLGASRAQMEESQALLIQETNRNQEIVSALEADLRVMREKLNETEADLVSIRAEKEALQASLEQVTEAPVTEPPSVRCQEILTQLSVHRQERSVLSDGEELCALAGRIQTELPDSLLPLADQCQVLRSLSETLASALSELRHRQPARADPFELPLLRAADRDRSNSQSSIVSERSLGGDSARSEPVTGADSEKDALLLKQQARLRQLTAAVRRRTEMRDDAVAKVRALEEEVGGLRAKLEQAEAELAALQTERDAWLAKMTDTDAQLAARLDEYSVAVNAEKEKWNEELMEKDNRIENLLEDISRKVVEIENLESELAEKDEKVSKLVEEMLDNADDIQDRQQQLFEKENEISSLKEEVSTLRSSLDEATAQREVLQEQLTQQQAVASSVATAAISEVVTTPTAPAVPADAPAKLEPLQMVSAAGCGGEEPGLVTDVRALMRQLRSLPASEAGALFSGGLDVVSLPSSGSDGQQRDSSEDNWSMVDERHSPGAASPLPTPAVDPPVPVAKDASPPSETSDTVTVVSAAPPTSGTWNWDEEWEQDPVTTAADVTDDVSQPEASAEPVSGGWGWGVDNDDGADEPTGGEAPPSGQWGWDEDAGWPSDDHPPSEALQLGNTEMVSAQVLTAELVMPDVEIGDGVEEIRRQLATTQREVADLRAEKERLQLQLGGQPASLSASMETGVNAGTPTDRMEQGLSEPCIGRELVEDLEVTEAAKNTADAEQAASRADGFVDREKGIDAGLGAEAEARSQNELTAQLETELLARLESESACRAEAEAALAREVETARIAQAQLEALSKEAERLRQELAAAAAKTESVERHLEENRVDTNHQWSALNFENSSLKSDLANTESDLMDLQSRYDTVEQERSEMVSKLEQHQRQLTRLQEEVSALRVTQEAAEQRSVEVDAQREAAEAARAAAVRLAERCLTELRSSADLVERLQAAGERWSEQSFAEPPPAEPLQQQAAAEVPAEPERPEVTGAPEGDTSNDYDHEGEEVASYFSHSHEIPCLGSIPHETGGIQPVIPPNTAHGSEAYFNPPAPPTTDVFQVQQGEPGAASYFDQEFQQAPVSAYFGAVEQHCQQEPVSYPTQACMGDTNTEPVCSPDISAQSEHAFTQASSAAPINIVPSAPPMVWDSLAVDSGTVQPHSVQQAHEDVPTPAVPVFSMFGDAQVASGSPLSSDPFAAIARPSIHHQQGQAPVADASSAMLSYPAHQQAVAMSLEHADGSSVAPHQYSVSDERPAPEGGASNTDLSYQLTSVSQQRDQLTLALATSQQEVEQLRGRLSAAQLDSEQLQLSSGDQGRQLAAALAERDELQLQVSDLAPAAEQLRAALAERIQLESELEAAQRQLDQLRLADDARHQLSLQVLESETKAEQLELRLSELEPAVARLPQLEQEIQSLQTQLMQIQQQRDSLQTQLVEREAQSNGLQQERDSVQVHLTQLEAQSSLLQQERDGLQNHLSQAQQERDGLRMQLFQAQQERDGLQNHLSQAQQERDGLQMQLSQVEHELSSLQVQLTELQISEKDWQLQLEKLTREKKQLEQALQEARQSPLLAVSGQQTGTPDAVYEPIVQSASNVFTTAAPGHSQDPAVETALKPSTTAKLFSASLFGGEETAPSSDLLDSFGFIPTPSVAPSPSPSAASAVAPSLIPPAAEQAVATSDSSEQINCLRADNEQLRTQLSELSTAAERCQQLEGELARQAAIQQQLVMTQTDNEALRAEIETLKVADQQLSPLLAENESLRHRLEVLSVTEQQLTSLRSEYETLRARHDGLVITEQQLYAIQSEYEAQRQRLEALADTEQQLVSLKADHTAQSSRLESLVATEEQLRGALAENEQLKAAVESARSTAEHITQLEADSQTLRSSLSEQKGMQASETVDEAQASESGIQPSEASADTSSLTKEKDDQLVESEQARSVLQAEKQAVENQLTSTATELDSVRAELETVKAQLQQYIEYYNYYASYYSQYQATQEYDQSQPGCEGNQTAQTYSDPLTYQSLDGAAEQETARPESVPSQAEAQGWTGDAAASEPFVNTYTEPTAATLDVSTGAAGDLTTVSLFSPAKPSQQAHSAASFFTPPETDGGQAAFDLTAPSTAGSGAVAETVVSAAQSVLPSAVLSFFGGGGGGAADPAASATEPQQTLAELQRENDRLRGRVSELEAKAAANQLTPSDPLVALTSSPFLEEAGVPPSRAELGWEEFSPSLEAASVPLHAPAEAEVEVARLTADLQAQKDQARVLELEKATLTQRLAELEPERQRARALEEEAAALRERVADAESQLNSDLQRERHHALTAEASEISALTALSDQAAADAEQLNQVTAELAAEREKLRQTAGQLASCNCRLDARREEAARLQEQISALTGQVTSLTAELESERARAAADGGGAFSLVCTSPQLPPDGGHISELQQQLSDLSAELEMERQRSAAADQQRTASDAQLMSLQQQLSAVSGELHTERERSWAQQHQTATNEEQLNSLQEQVSLLSAELQAEKERSQAAIQSSATSAGDNEAAHLSAQLAEELATVAELTSELEAERADVSRLEGEVQMLRDLLADTQSQLSSARAVPAAADTALADQVAFYRQKVTELETAIAAGKEELQQAKVKNGRLLQKLKLQQKKGASGMADALDTAMLEELQGQAVEATRRAEDAELKARELLAEKTRLADQVSTYQDAQDRLVEAKEHLDVEVHTLRVENDRLRHQLRDMEWRLAELEEAAESGASANTAQLTHVPGAAAAAEAPKSSTEALAANTVSEEVASTPANESASLMCLLQEKADLELKLTELELRNEELLELYDRSRAVSSQTADSQLQRSVEQLQLALDAAATENQQLSERLVAYEAHWASQQAAAAGYSAPLQQQLTVPADIVTAGSVPPLAELAQQAGQVPVPQTTDHQTAEEEHRQTAEDASSRLRSREAIIHSMADEISGLRAANAALLAESAHWRTLAEEGEDGDLLDGLNHNLAMVNEALQSREARCRELTSEVAQLLEERDLLQLRLSSSLRLNQANQPETSQEPPSAQTEDIRQLKNKLAELKQLNYLLDIQLQGEVAERRRLQMSLQSEVPRHQMSPNTSTLVSSSAKDI